MASSADPVPVVRDTLSVPENIVKLIINVVGEDTFSLDVDSSVQVEDLKKRIEILKGISSQRQKLICRGKKLETGTLQQNKVTKKATLLLIKHSEPEKEQKGTQVICKAGCGFWGFG
jgi:hypothetical protein